MKCQILAPLRRFLYLFSSQSQSFCTSNTIEGDYPDESTQLKLWWRAQGADGFPVAIKQSSLTVAGTLDVSFAIDTNHWPAGQYDITVGLSDGNSFLDAENVQVTLLGIRPQWAVDNVQRIAPGQMQTNLRLYLYDQDGLAQAALAESMRVEIDGTLETVQIAEPQAGIYDIVLDTKHWTVGSHNITVSTENALAVSTTVIVEPSYSLFLPNIVSVSN